MCWQFIRCQSEIYHCLYQNVSESELLLSCAAHSIPLPCVKNRFSDNIICDLSVSLFVNLAYMYVCECLLILCVCVRVRVCVCACVREFVCMVLMHLCLCARTNVSKQ